MKKILVIVGTRPEAIKMSPLINELKARSDFDVCVVNTGQHREILDEVLDLFDVKPDFDLSLMKPGQSLNGLSQRVLADVGVCIASVQPDLVLVHGDTTSAAFAAIAAFYNNIEIGHVEAGLRSYDLSQPFPEEFNRKLISTIAAYHFAPTQGAKDNLLKEGISSENIYVTGNTVIDALRSIPSDGVKRHGKQVLITIHRRENLGLNIEIICKGIANLAKKNAAVKFVFPMHPNPRVRTIVKKELSEFGNVELREPLGYQTFVNELRASFLVLTDSGGIQEEAPSIDIPVVVFRAVTERPEALDTEIVHLVNADVSKMENLFMEYLEMADVKAAVYPFGDGRASTMIADAISQ